MGRYVARRLIQFIPVILGTLFLLHLLSVVTIQIVGDPVRALFGPNAPPDAVIAQLQAQYGLDDPCLEQTGNPCIGMFFDRMGQYAQGDFGTNFRGRPVSELFVERIWVTARLTVIALVFEIVIGIFIGVLAGLRKDKLIDNFVRLSTSLLIAVPGVRRRVAGGARWSDSSSASGYATANGRRSGWARCSTSATTPNTHG